MQGRDIVEKKKVPCWQVVRGICILAVILIHCPNGIPYGTGSAEFRIWFLLRNLYNFPVAMFFFMAGYFVNYEQCIKNKKSFLIKRSQRLIVPFFFWSVFYTLVSVLFSVLNNSTVKSAQLFHLFINGKAGPQLYFVLVLLQLTIITPYLIGTLNKTTLKSLMLYCITPAYLVLLYVYCFKAKALPSRYYLFFPAWFVFYYLGLHIQKKNTFVRFLNSYILLFIALLLSIAESFYLLLNTGVVSFACSQIRFCNFIVVFVIISLILCRYSRYIETQMEKTCIIKSFTLMWLKKFGDYSYGIFYCHYFFIIIIQFFFGEKINSIWFLYAMFTFILTSVLSLLFVEFSNKFFKKYSFGDKLLKLVGFR